MGDGPILEARGLAKTFAVRRGAFGGGAGRSFSAVDGVSFTVARGEAVGLVGESGCGKTTVARMVLGLLRPDAGEVVFRGSHVQAVFQDPYGSLDPGWSAARVVEEGLAIRGVGRAERRAKALALLERVGLPPDAAARRPRDFSGGQRQRIAIARALATDPDLIVLDEPVSALDVSVAAQVINLLQDLQAELGMAFLFIAHDLAIVRHLCHRTCVMRAGKLVEQGPTAGLFASPRHPYTRELLSAAMIFVPSPCRL